MNRSLQVEDVSLDSILQTNYSAAFLASGYESRCVSLSRRLSAPRIKKVSVLGFEKEVLPSLRQTHDLHFRQKWGLSPTRISNCDFSMALNEVEKVIRSAKAKAPLRILVDYSSMSRIWYAAIINFFRFSRLRSDVTIDFAYTPGGYSSSYSEELRSSVVSEIVSIAGMEGLSGTRESSIAGLGLGFTPSAALGVLERLQPALVFSYYASPGVRQDYDATCIAANERLLNSSKFSLPLPIKSVSTAYRKLCEAMTPYLASEQITLIPMGPKPLVLASMLVASRFRQVGCLYAQLVRRDVSDIEEYGQPIGVRVIMQEHP